MSVIKKRGKIGTMVILLTTRSTLAKIASPDLGPTGAIADLNRAPEAAKSELSVRE